MKRRLQGLESGDERARFNRETFASISIGYDQSVIAPAEQNGQEAPGAVRLTLGTLLLGGTYRFNDKVALGAGLTRDTPDLTLTARVPITFQATAVSATYRGLPDRGCASRVFHVNGVYFVTRSAFFEVATRNALPARSSQGRPLE